MTRAPKRIDQKHILMVSDNLPFGYGAAVALKKNGYRVSAATGGGCACETILRDDTIDLVLVDLSRSQRSGEGLLQAAGKMDLQTPIAAISTGMDAGQIDELMRKGYTAVIDRAADPGAFVRQVGLMLQNRERGGKK